MLLHRILSYAVQAGPAVLVWGPPGVGKSVTFEEMAAAWEEPIEVVTASNRDPSDFGGLPVRTDEGVTFEPMAWAKRLATAGKGIFLADEYSCAPISCQHALLRVILDRVVGDLTLPKTVRIVAAANPADIANGWELTPPTANRFIHLYWKVSGEYLKYWQKGMIEGWSEVTEFPKAPDDWEKTYLPQARVLVSSFIGSNPAALFEIPKDESKRSGPWPSPRTWDFATRVLAVAWNEPKEVVLPLVAGCIGEGHAVAFMAWREKLDLPDPMDLLNNPSSFKVPKETDRLFVILNSVVTTAISNPSPKTWNNAWEILLIAVKKSAKDIPAAAALTLANGEPFMKGYTFNNKEVFEAFEEIFTKILEARNKKS